MTTYGEGARLGVPLGLAVKTGGPIVAIAARYNDASDERVREDLATLPSDLDRIDAWIGDGVLSGDELNAADLQIAASLALAEYRRDVRAAVAGRPCQALLDRVLPLPSAA
jgi:glutathione S-transferase